MVLAGSHRTSRTPCYSGSSYAVHDFAYRAFTFFGSSFQMILLSFAVTFWSPTTPALPKQQPVWAVPFSLAATGEITFVFFSTGY